MTPSILRNYKVLLLLIFVILSIVIIAPNPAPSGHKIIFIGKDAPEGLKVGSVLYKIDNEPISQATLAKTYIGIVKFDTAAGTQFARVNGTLNIETEPVQTTNLRFGLDLRGGVHALVRVNDSDREVASQVKSTLENRINLFGLREALFRNVEVENEQLIEISIAGGTRQELLDLLQTQGRFEGRITFPTNTLNLDQRYTITLNGTNATINGITFAPGDSFELDEILFVYEGRSGTRANLTAHIFDGSDIRTVFFDPQRSRIENTGQGYQWSFAVQISPESAERFARVTRNAASLGSYLDAQISLYLDDELIDALNIASSLKGRAETEISISGGADTAQQAAQERSRLQAVLRSGALPAAIEVLSIDSISPTLGADFINSAVLAGIGAVLGVILVVLIRYRRLRLVVPMIATSLSEIVIIMGLATALNWTIDLPAIAAIIATVGTGVNAQIIMIDQTLRGGEAHTENFREKLKRAFFIIFGSAGTMIAAMLPLTFSGFSVLRGFAIVTMIGVLSGALITRPAFGAMVEKFLKKGHPHEHHHE